MLASKSHLTTLGFHLLIQSSHFNNGAFADVTITFSGRDVLCHKLILCDFEYFQMMCGPGSQFAESQRNTVELHGDDPDAVEAMLR